MPLHDCQQGVTITYDFTNSMCYNTIFFGKYINLCVNSKWSNDTEFSTSKDINLQYTDSK
jgi:hypothetical protein